MEQELLQQVLLWAEPRGLQRELPAGMRYSLL
jgi:hypothetical protein